MDVLAGADGLGEGRGRLFTHEEPHVGADAVLLVDNAEADAGVARVEIGEDFSQGGAGPRHFSPAAGIGVKRRGDEDPHQTDAALTE